MNDFYTSPQERNLLNARGIFGNYEDAMFPMRQSLIRFPNIPHPPASMFGIKRKTTKKKPTKKKTVKKTVKRRKTTATTKKKQSKFGTKKRVRNKN